MFDSYNKKNTQDVLVGNWVEEAALRDRTGFARRKVPAPLFASDRQESRKEPTHERVIVHDKRTHLTCNSHASETSPPHFETTFQASTRYSEHRAEKDGRGPRQSLRDTQLLEAAKRLYSDQRARDEELAALERRAPPVTVTQSSFVPWDSSALTMKRVPRGLNGSLSRHIDPKVQHLTKKEVDRMDRKKLDLLQDAAVTRYSYAVTSGVGLDFPTTTSDGSNAFGRSSTFTNELPDATKRHGEATEPGWLHPERLGASVHQRSALKKLLNLLKTKPEITQRLLDIMTHGAESSRVPDEYIELREFRAACSSAGAALPLDSVVHGVPDLLTEKEVIHVFMYFDIDNIGAIRLGALSDYCTSLGEKRPFTSQYTYA